MLGSNCYLGFLGGSDGKESVFDAGDLGSVPRSGRFPWRRAWKPTPIFLPGESHGQRRLAGCSPWGHKESDTTKQLTYMHTELGMHLLGVPSLPQKGNSAMKPRDSIPWKAACFGGPMTGCSFPLTVY